MVTFSYDGIITQRSRYLKLEVSTAVDVRHPEEPKEGLKLYILSTTLYLGLPHLYSHGFCPGIAFVQGTRLYSQQCWNYSIELNEELLAQFMSVRM